MICPKCGGTMNGIAFITEYAVADYRLLKLRFVADRPPPSHVFEQVALMAVIIRDYEERKPIVF